MGVGDNKRKQMASSAVARRGRRRAPSPIVPPCPPQPRIGTSGAHVGYLLTAAATRTLSARVRAPGCTLLTGTSRARTRQAEHTAANAVLGMPPAQRDGARAGPRRPHARAAAAGAGRRTHSMRLPAFAFESVLNVSPGMPPTSGVR